MLFELMVKHKETNCRRDEEIQSILGYLIRFRQNFFDKNPMMTKEERLDMENDMYMLAVEKYDMWDQSKGVKFLTYIYSSFGLTFSNFVIKNITGINVKRWDCVQHKKEHGHNLLVETQSIDFALNNSRSLSRQINEKLEQQHISKQTSWEAEEEEWLGYFNAQ